MNGPAMTEPCVLVVMESTGEEGGRPVAVGLDRASALRGLHAYIADRGGDPTRVKHESRTPYTDPAHVVEYWRAGPTDMDVGLFGPRHYLWTIVVVPAFGHVDSAPDVLVPSVSG